MEIKVVTKKANCKIQTAVMKFLKDTKHLKKSLF